MSTTPNNMDEGKAPEAAPHQEVAPQDASSDSTQAGRPDLDDELAGPSAEELDALVNELESGEPDADAVQADDPQPAAKPQPAPLATDLQSRI
ncbi:MAG: hypothetical protein ACTSWM_04865, partial [Alphaproteobacteria bacterium]